MDTHELRQRIIDDPDVPEVVRHFLSKGAEIEEIRLDARGRWTHEGGVFENQKLSRLFGRSLRRTTQGNWVIELPPYTYPIIVEQFGWFVRRMEEVEAGWGLHLTNGEQVVCSPDSIRTDGDTVLAVELDDGRHARLIDGAYQEALDRIEEGAEGWTIRHGKARLRVGPLE